MYLIQFFKSFCMTRSEIDLLVGWLVGISTFVGYLTTIQFSISTVKLSKTFLFQTIQAVVCNNSVKCKYSFNVEKQFYLK